MPHTHGHRLAYGFWARVGAALAALARLSGCSVEQSPLPELREVARDLRDWPGSPPAGTAH
jgi:hypothetical protein